MTDTAYVPPRVWTWDQQSGGRWASINRPISGPTHDTELPVGQHPFQLYPNRLYKGRLATVCQG